MAAGQTRTNLLVGFFVLGGLALFTILLLFIGGKGEPFAQRVLIKSRFDQVGGLLEGAPVRLTGVDIGTVQSIRFSDTDQAVVVMLDIGARVADRIARDAKAHVRQLGLLGDKYIEIVQGNLELGTIKEAKYIEGRAPFEIAEVYEGLEEIVTNIRDASAKVGGAIDLYASPETARNLKDGIAAAKTLLQEVRDGSGFLHAVIYENAHQGILKDLGVASANLKTSSDFLENILGEVRAGRGSLHTLIYGQELTATITDLAKISKALLDVSEQIQSGEGLAHRLVYDKEAGLIAADLRAASDNVKQVTLQLREGKGTLGALIQDPALYEDLRLLLGGAGRSSWMRYIIRSMVEENEERAIRDAK